MKFIENIKKEDYIKFFNRNKNAHFLQSYSWGTASEKNRGYKSLYVGVIDDKNNLIAACLLLKKETPLNMCYLYCPRGFIIDYSNNSLLEFFVTNLKIYLKKINAIYLKVDPGIKYQTINKDANKIDGENNYKLFNKLINLGFKHKGFYKLYEGNQPRYTIRIPLKKDFEQIKKEMSKSFLKTIRKSDEFDIVINESNDLKKFYELAKNNSKKDDFKLYSYEYYKNIYNSFKEENKIKIFEASLNPFKVTQKFKKEISELENITSEKKKLDRIARIQKLKNDIDFLQKYKKDEVVCSLICVYTNYGAWSLYIGNNELGTKTHAVNKIYFESIKDAYDKGFEFYDLFGTIGDPQTSYKNLAGLHDFKRKFGGEYLEFMGEFDLINKKIWYKLLPVLLKIYRKIRGNRT